MTQTTNPDITDLTLLNTAVVGAGLMGTGIARHLVSNGAAVTLLDMSEDQLANARQALADTPVNFTTAMDDLSQCDFVIEAVFEDLNVKRAVLADISRSVNEQCIVASNTSSLLIGDLASAVQHANRFIGVHYNNPADFNPIVEIIPCTQTRTELPPQLVNWFNAADKMAVQCADTPCFILNRQSLPYINEAARCLQIASPGEIDAIALNRLGVGLGPFAVMNLVGIDVMAAASANLAVLGNGYQASQALQNQREPWHIEASAMPSKDVISQVTQRLRGAMIFPAKDILDQQLCSAEDLHQICVQALGYEKSSVEWLDILEPPVIAQLLTRYLSNQPHQ